MRIVVVEPPPNVRFAMQRGRDQLVEPVRASARELVFETTVRVRDNRPDGLPNFLGETTQGPVFARFVYINSGVMAGDEASPWTRRVKVPLSGITWEVIEKARNGKVLEARFRGTARDGGPAAATVPLIGGWKVTARPA
ncbi:MAG: hypothetical protein JO197_04350 [Acidobacteria bacterium]|nr:hypothetical protein [Acidobacteriota bacterium]MBV9478554.1 hypothetical protein [Acidobacteriota bacterium]